MKWWRVKRFLVEEINYQNSGVDINIANTLYTKEEAYKTAIKNVTEKVDANLDSRERLLKEIEDQEGVILYYIKKRNKLLVDAKSENIDVDDVIL